MPPGLARWLAVIGAPLIGAALVSQGWISTQNMVAQGGGVGEGVWRYLGYFTVLTNTMIVAVLARAALRPGDRRGLNAPRTELMAVTSILFVGGVYNVLLASQWDPQGLQKLNDEVLHIGAPILFAVYWLAGPRGGIGWKDALFAAAWPCGYAIYGLSRGALDGFYPYFFMNPATTPWIEVARNMAALVGVFVVAALLLATLDRRLARSGPQN